MEESTVSVESFHLFVASLNNLRVTVTNWNISKSKWNKQGMEERSFFSHFCKTILSTQKTSKGEGKRWCIWANPLECSYLL